MSCIPRQMPSVGRSASIAARSSATSPASRAGRIPVVRGSGSAPYRAGSRSLPPARISPSSRATRPAACSGNGGTTTARPPAACTAVTYTCGSTVDSRSHGPHRASSTYPEIPISAATCRRYPERAGRMSTVRTGRGFERLITFADAVVAIALTLLVLPLVEITAQLHEGESVGRVLADHGDEVDRVRRQLRGHLGTVDGAPPDHGVLRRLRRGDHAADPAVAVHDRGAAVHHPTAQQPGVPARRRTGLHRRAAGLRAQPARHVLVGPPAPGTAAGRAAGGRRLGQRHRPR